MAPLKKGSPPCHGRYVESGDEVFSDDWELGIWCIPVGTF